MGRPAAKAGAARLVAEFGVIVLGVLVALILEAWWSGSEDRAFERQLRTDMVAEFQENLAILDADLEENARASQVLNRFTDLSDEALAVMPDTAFSIWTDGSFTWAGFDAAMGNARAIVSSGNLGAISDRELRLRLARWSGLMEEKQRFNKNSTEYYLKTVSPLAFRLAADGRWALDERREMRSHVVRLGRLQGLEIRNQANLRDAAQSLIDYLGG